MAHLPRDRREDCATFCIKYKRILNIGYIHISTHRILFISTTIPDAVLVKDYCNIDSVLPDLYPTPVGSRYAYSGIEITQIMKNISKRSRIEFIKNFRVHSRFDLGPTRKKLRKSNRSLNFEGEVGKCVSISDISPNFGLGALKLCLPLVLGVPLSSKFQDPIPNSRTCEDDY